MVYTQLLHIRAGIFLRLELNCSSNETGNVQGAGKHLQPCAEKSPCKTMQPSLICAVSGPLAPLHFPLVGTCCGTAHVGNAWAAPVQAVAHPSLVASTHLGLRSRAAHGVKHGGDRRG